ncbi:MAG: glycosyltransferase [Myxococcota bacterium]|jgi:glycosyltransferase involved in cell wall biosynthesis|nr:glycosyltransferase [Myxococcota bacterium]
MSRTIIVVPCYNEAHRFDEAAFAAALEADRDLTFFFVDDGSLDQTRTRLEAFAEPRGDRCRVIVHTMNQGKAAAVRTGLLEAFATDADYCGFWDADLAAPLDELPQFIDILEHNPLLDLAIGSRVKLLGRKIERNPMRHYLGRIAATIASLLLNLPVYDTQCGAKLFRNTPAMAKLFEEPLTSGWVFDVELIARLVRNRRDGGLPSAEQAIYEVPLRRWKDVAGSKIKPADYLRAFVDVLRVYRRTLRH